MKEKFLKQKGITLIALIVTIIVLLILAGVSVRILTGSNSILNKGTEAREITEIAQLKEQAELVKDAMLIDKKLNGTEELTRSELIAGIVADSNFKGSTRNGDKVVTAGEKYDIKVENDLSISVEKHVATVGKKIILTLDEEETESRAAILKVTATIDGLEEPTAASLKEELDPEDTGNTEELKAMFLKALNVVYKAYGMNFPTWSDLETAVGGTQTPSSVFAMIKDALPRAGYTSTEMYAWLIEMGVYKPDITLTCSNGDEITVTESGEFVIATNGSYTVTASDDDGDYGEGSKTITKCGIVETYTTTAVTADEGKNSKTVRDSDNNPVEVPAGFYYGTSSNVGKVSTGFVITDSVDGNGNSTGNEFVWIPVDKTTLQVSGTDKYIAKESTGNFAGTDSKGNTNYEGVLYENFSETSSSVMSDYGQNDNNDYYREPALVTDYDNDTSKPDGSEQTYLGQIGLTADQFKTEMIENYNAMIKSIQTYGGFYVARYEMGVENNKLTSKLGVLPATAYDSATKYWYGLYKMAKTYTTSSVQSSMIWGSQYDAMLNFALTGSDKAKVTETTNETANGNRGIRTKTGLYKGSDCINNIYDLEGNLKEWTLEAYSDTCRIFRGYDMGLLSDDGRQWGCARVRGSTMWRYAGSKDASLGSRTALYIK